MSAACRGRMTLLDLMKAEIHPDSRSTKPTYDARVARCGGEVVRRQVETAASTIVSDGEYSKPGFFTYVTERLEGFEARPGREDG